MHCFSSRSVASCSRQSFSRLAATLPCASSPLLPSSCIAPSSCGIDRIAARPSCCAAQRGEAQQSTASSTREAAVATRSHAAEPQLQPQLFAATSLMAMAMAQAPALADAGSLASSNPFEGVQANSLYVTLGLFLMSVPGIWSQVKRAPAATKKRKTYEVDGPARPGSMPIDERARQIFRYFKKYNYEVKSTGEVITFAGLYAADKGQAAAVTFYTFCGMASIALVLSTLYPEIGNWWYALTLLSPGAWAYYMSRGTRQEEIKVKMVTADDDQTIDITVEGDQEELVRFSKELQLMEKGMIYVKGILEGQ